MRWKNRPEGSNWGDFGPDDQVGRLNLITPERRRAAAAEVREGLAFNLSLPLDYPRGQLIGFRNPPRLFTTSGAHGHPLRDDHVDICCDDGVTLALQFSSQWDALAHMGAAFDADGDGEAERVFYNGFRAGADVSSDSEGVPCVRHLGIETLSETCVQGRGVMVDLHREAGRNHAAVGYDRLMRTMEAQGATVEPGDMLCLYTGFDRVILDLGEQITPAHAHTTCASLDAGDPRLLRWIDESGLVALISDNVAVEGFGPNAVADGDVVLPIHHLCLFKLGIPPGELWYLEELNRWLAANGRTRFLLTAPPLRLPGAVGSPATGVATV